MKERGVKNRSKEKKEGRSEKETVLRTYISFGGEKPRTREKSQENQIVAELFI